jgi:hypothetical protein
MPDPTFTTLPPAPSRAVPSTFSARTDPFLAGMVVFQGELNTAVSWFSSTTSTVAINAATASAAATSAAASATLASAASGAVLHVPSASYTAGDAAISNTDYAAYRCILTHTGVATDPSADATNWTLAVPAGAQGFEVGDVNHSYEPLTSPWFELNGQTLAKSTQAGLRAIFGDSEWGYDSTGVNPNFAILPDTAPTGASYGLSIHTGEVYYAIAHSISPYVSFYNWNSGAPTKLTSPATLPTGNGRSVAYSPSGDFCAVAHDTTPFVTFYDTSTPSAPVKLTDPATLPPASGYGVSWTPDSRYCAVAAYAGSNCMTIYDFNSGAPVKLVGVPSSQPSGTGWDCKYSPDGTYLAVCSGSSPYIALYDNTTPSSPARMADPAVLPSALAKFAEWSPDSRYLAVQENGLGQLIYDFNTGTPVEVTFDTEPGNTSGIAWISNTRVMWFGTSLEIYEIVGGVAVLQTPFFNPNLGYNTTQVRFFSDASYVLASNQSPPYSTARVLSYDITTHFPLPLYNPDNFESAAQPDAPTAYVKGE